MRLRKELLQRLELYLSSMPSKTMKRARGYFARGDVLQLECVTPDQEYAAVVRGGEDYQVNLKFADGLWTGQCSCRIGLDCRHIVASMLLLQTRGSEGRKSADSARERVMNAAKARWQLARSESRVSQAPRSPLSDRLVQSVGRALLPAEIDFLHRVQTIYHTARIRQLTESDFRAIAGHNVASNAYSYWEEICLWPNLPQDDFHFWLYLAWELRRRQLRWPTFMNGITVLSLIEPDMRQWERQKEIAQWQSWFREFQPAAPVADSDTLDLRLVVLQNEARLQFRTAPEAQFVDLKQTQARKLAEEFESGTLIIAPDSLPLWSAAYKPWQYDSWWSFKYANATAHPALNRLLRMSIAADRVVTGTGQPLARLGEPLRLELRPPRNGDGNYELALATADGTSPPRILCKLDGQPTLYLTEGGLFRGPSADALDKELSKSIPTDALETTDGLRFLHATGVPLPEHLQQRIQTVPVKIVISCGLRPIYPESPCEDVIIAVTASAPGMPKEKFTHCGWEVVSNHKTRMTPTKRGVISVYDRVAQKQFPRVLDPLAPKWDSYAQDWKLRLTKKTPALFVQWLKSLPPEIEVLLDSELATLRDAPISGMVSLDIAEAGIDWFDLKVALNVNDTTLTQEELKLLLNARGGYVRLGKKGWRRLQFNLSTEEEEQLAHLGLNARDFSAEPQRFHALQLANDAAKQFLAPEHVEIIQRRADELKTRVAPALPGSIRAEMRPYQIEGFHFLAYLTSNRFGGVLADDMGLGKTLQTLAWLAWLRESAVNSQPPTRDPALVVCPKSVMDNWRAEAVRFFPDLRVRLWRGEPAEDLPAARDNCDLVVINYAQLRALSPGIANAPWLAAILDEAQCIKNPLGLKTHQQLNQERFNILTSLLRLRQICCHPALVDGTLRDAESAKLSALEDLLEPLMDEGHKVLVFSQFVTMLDLLRDTVKRRDWPHFYLAGDTENRGELIQSFQAAKDGAVFLLSLKAGGFGLNLTAASYVVLFDPWWNPAVENQAIDRTHRIGQTSKVIAYRLLMRESIEQKIRLLQKQKASLAEDVLGEERFAQSLTLDDLRFLFAE